MIYIFDCVAVGTERIIYYRLSVAFHEVCMATRAKKCMLSRAIKIK